MSDASDAKWLERGNVHLAAGRAIDALACYRRALRGTGNGAEARFQLGKIAWQIGNSVEAVGLWRQVAEASPGGASAPVVVLAWRALADSLAMLGRFDEAAAAAAEVLARRPQSKRMRWLGALLDVARGRVAGSGSATEAPGGATVAAADHSGLSAAFGAREAWPLALVAAVTSRLVVGRVPDDLLRSALDAAWRTVTEGPVLRGTEDGLRIVARNLAVAGDDERAKAVAMRHEAVCADLAAGSAPACWPWRAAGGALRIGILRSAESDANGAVAAKLVAELESTLGSMPESHSVPIAASAASTSTTALAACAWTVVDLDTLPQDADAAARSLAMQDFDVLIDAGGLAHASGPVLARRPARRSWGFAGTAALATPALVDRVFVGAAGEVVAALVEEAKRSPPIPGEPARSPQTPAELAAQRDAAVIAHRDGDLDTARAGYDWILARQPADPQTYYLRAMLERDRGHVDVAIADLRAAVDAAPGYVDARAALAQMLTARGAATDAAALVRAGLAQGTLARSKRSASLWRALGQAELARGHAAAAAAAFAEALVRAPDHAESHYNHGVALQRQGDPDGAARAWQRSLALDPDLEAAHYNLGVVFDQQGRTDGAVAAFTRALELAPTHVDAHKALGETLHAAGRVDDWVAIFRRFEANCADHIAVAPMAIEVAVWTGDYALLDRTLEGLRSNRFGARDAGEFIDALQQLLFLLLYVDVEPELVVRYSRLHNDLARRLYGEPRPRATTRRPGRLRIGYASGDFRDHVMGKMIWAALRHHDHARFEVFGYTTDRRRDAWTTRIAGTFDHFEDVSALDDAAAAHRIAADDLDLLVDLSTHTKGARPGILSLKPARVQVTHVASAGTTALASIDFKLTDRYADVEGSFVEGLEAPLIMDGCVYPWRDLPAAQVPAELPTTPPAPTTRSERVVIGAFVTPLKLSQRCLALWREVLQRIPRAVLAFSPLDPRSQAAYRSLAAGAGIDPGRVVFVPRSGDEATDLARYRGVDFVLDPMPYGGVNGTLEPLAMGVPVVALVGRRHGERSSYSILTNLGVGETIAQTGPEYVEIAVRLADDPSFMQAVRQRIEAGIARSTLTDMKGHTRNLEHAYVAALEQRAPEALTGDVAASDRS